MHHRCASLKHHTFFTKHLGVCFGNQAIEPGQQGISAVHREQQFFGLGLAAQQHRECAASAVKPRRQHLQVTQAGTQRAIAARQTAEAFNQVFGRGDQLGHLTSCIALEHDAYGTVLKQRVGQQTGIGADVGAAHQAAYQGKNA